MSRRPPHKASRRHALRRSIVRGLLGVPLSATALLAAQPASSTRAPESLPPVGNHLPLVDIALLDGGTFRAAKAEGQVLVLYWWASWCPFCAAQSPHMQKLWDAHGERGLMMLGISIDKRIEDARRYMSQRGYTFPSGFNSPALERVLPKPRGLPVTCVRGRDGRIVMAEAGQLFPEDVAEIARFL